MLSLCTICQKKPFYKNDICSACLSIIEDRIALAQDAVFDLGEHVTSMDWSIIDEGALISLECESGETYNFKVHISGS